MNVNKVLRVRRNYDKISTYLQMGHISWLDFIFAASHKSLVQGRQKE